MATTDEPAPTIRTAAVRAAVVQAAPALLDTPRTGQNLADLTADAALRAAGHSVEGVLP